MYRAARSESGAAAVEFALISLAFLTLLFGVIQYGLYFNDSMNTRQAVREGARQAVVENFAFMSSCSTGTNATKLACSTRLEVGALMGKDNVSMHVTASSWAKAQPVLVCAVTRSPSFFGGFIPLPNGGYIKSKTQMSIEQFTQAGSWANYTGDPDPTGGSWGWCS